MPITLDFRDNGVIIWERGVITDDQFLNAEYEIYDHKFKGDFQYQLAVMSEVTDFHVSSETMLKVAEIDKNHPNKCKQYAVVVAASDKIFGMCRQWNMNSEDDLFITNVVRNLDDALSWFRKHDIEIKI
ncbi:MAG: hypothetical protein OEY89_06490 [Gammaproteobacteria bacterium]|nr:hypothetical protein [Gammaproteobacteria bacterium]